ncbi:MAG: protein-L-isoaspartate(D-aspartate) O-methyltransferase [Gemmatimonadetes bacterium]|nr:protein-L-isoaspartate(D-aspartate) O-methyltransferase [Gemmatimonadota bacterium]
MVDQQLVRRGIRDLRVLDAMAKVPRQRFVPEEYRHLAYDDSALPIGECQTISQPYMVAVMTEALGLEPGSRVLEVGTGSGYQTAILAELAAQVYTVERFDTLSENARALLCELGYRNILSRVGDGSKGWPEAAPFDAILVTAAAREIPEELEAQLAPQGRLVIPIGDRTLQDLYRVSREGEGWRMENITSCRFVPLVAEAGWPED